MSEREEELMQSYQLDYEQELRSLTVCHQGLRFHYDDGELDSVEWFDPEEFLASQGEKLFEDAYAEDNREAQKILSYAWLLIRQAEAKEEDEKLKEQGRVKLRKIENLCLDSDMESYLEELCDPKGL
jgi:hypothetical protein